MRTEDILSHYEQTIDFARRLEKLRDAEWRTEIANGKWTIAEVMGHFQPWDELVLTKRIPYFHGKKQMPKGPDRDRVNETSAARSNKATKSEILQAFIMTRKNLLAKLRALQYADWQKMIIIGHTKITVIDYFHGLVDHDLHHFQQVTLALPGTKQLQQPTRTGVDELGLIINPTAVENIQPHYKSIIDDALLLLQHTLRDKLHSVYVYGSVGRGEAIYGRSDLDLTVLLTDPITATENDLLHLKTKQWILHYPSLLKVDYDMGTTNEVMSTANFYLWGFWLKHMCTCVYGNDLSECFPRMKPSSNIGEALNGDLLSVLDRYERELFHGTVSPSRKQSIVKRMVRGAYFTVIVNDESFSTNIKTNLKIIQLYYNEMLFQEMDALLDKKGIVSETKLLELLRSFRSWYLHISSSV